MCPSFHPLVQILNVRRTLCLLKPEESVVNWTEVMGTSRLSLSEALVERLQEIFEFHPASSPLPYELSLELQHIVEIVRHVLRNIPQDSSLSSQVRGDSFCRGVVQVAVAAVEHAHAVAEYALGLFLLAVTRCFHSLTTFVQKFSVCFRRPLIPQ